MIALDEAYNPASYMVRLLRYITRMERMADMAAAKLRTELAERFAAEKDERMADMAAAKQREEEEGRNGKKGEEVSHTP